MSSLRMVKNGSGIELPNDTPIIELKIMSSGVIQLHAPQVHPKDVCKMLNNLVTELMFSSFQPAEVPRIQPPM
jgi:hypothetical protein